MHRMFCVFLKSLMLVCGKGSFDLLSREVRCKCGSRRVWPSVTFHVYPYPSVYIQPRASPSGACGTSSTRSYAKILSGIADRDFGDDVLEAFATMTASNVYAKVFLRFLHHQGTWKFNFYPAQHKCDHGDAITILQLYIPRRSSSDDHD